VILVEVIGRRGDVVQRVTIAQLPATVGRAWNNDVILQDPHVDALHARIVADASGALAIEDVGSLNGMYADGTAQRVSKLPLAGLATVRLGRTMLRIVNADHPVPAAVPDIMPTGRLARLFASPRGMLAIAVTGVALTALAVWLSDYQDKGAGALAGKVVGVVSFVGLWAGLWAFVGRLILHRTNFWAHTTLAWLLLITIGLWGSAESWLDFLFPAQQIVDVIGVMIALALLVAGIATHAGLASPAPRRRRLVFGLALAAGFVGLAWLGDKATQSSGFGDDVVTIPVTLKPLSTAMIPATSVDRFMTRMADVKREVDRLDKE
jgi:hypothetical protein